MVNNTTPEQKRVLASFKLEKSLIKLLGGLRSVRQLKNNQTAVKYQNGEIFHSYDSIISLELFNKGQYLYIYSNHWNFSRTTCKYLYDNIGFNVRGIYNEQYKYNDNLKKNKSTINLNSHRKHIFNLSFENNFSYMTMTDIKKLNKFLKEFLK